MKYVDLFAGCGGLSLGLESEGIEPIFAVEKSDMAARTYAHNLLRIDAKDPETWSHHLVRPLAEQARAGIIVSELAQVLEERDLLDKVKCDGIDAVVGGPPCQGFSLAGRRNPDDIRNQLPWQFLEFVDATHPTAVVIENVIGMGASFNTDEKSSFHAIQEALRNPELRPEGKRRDGREYVVQGVLANAFHYGAPQHRPRLLVVGLLKETAEEIGVESSGDLWRSDFRTADGGTYPPLVPLPVGEEQAIREIRLAISDLMKSATEESKKYRESLDAAFSSVVDPTIGAPRNHTLRKHRPSTEERFRLYQLMQEAGVRPRLLRDLALAGPEEDQRRIFDEALGDKGGVHFDGMGKVIADDNDELFAIAKCLSTRKHSQRALAWGDIARTVVTLPDDYVHPIEPRTFSVRELARFQGFPDGFEFLGPETTGAHRRKLEVPQYTQVGNAVSPWLGKALGRMLKEVAGDRHALENSEEGLADRRPDRSGFGLCGLGAVRVDIARGVDIPVMVP